MRRTTIFKILTLIYIATVAVICFARFSSLPTVPGKIFGLDADKVVHYLMFMPFPVLAYFSFPLERKSFWGAMGALLLILLLGAGLAGITEYVQGKLPYRSMDINDFKADVLGMATSSLVIFIIRLFTPSRKNA